MFTLYASVTEERKGKRRRKPQAFLILKPDPNLLSLLDQASLKNVSVFPDLFLPFPAMKHDFA